MDWKKSHRFDSLKELRRTLRDRRQELSTHKTALKTTLTAETRQRVESCIDDLKAEISAIRELIAERQDGEGARCL